MVTTGSIAAVTAQDTHSFAFLTKPAILFSMAVCFHVLDA